MSVAIQASSVSSENPAPLAAVAQAPAAVPATASDGAEQFRHVLGSLGRAIDAGEKMVRRALTPSAGALGAAELIALQAGIYRYSEAITSRPSSWTGPERRCAPRFRGAGNKREVCALTRAASPGAGR